MDLEGAGERLVGGEEPLLERGDDQHRRSAPGAGGVLEAGFARLPVALKEVGEDELWGVLGKVPDVDADDLALGELLTDLPEVVLQPADHHGVPRRVVDGDAAAELLRVQHLEEGGEAVGVAVVGGRREEELVLEPGGEVTDGPGDLGVDGVARPARRGRVVGLVEDEKGAAREVPQPVAERGGVGLVPDQRVGEDEAAVGGPRVDRVAALLASGGDEVAVVDHEGEPEALLHLVLPLPHHGGGARDHDPADLLAHEKLAKDEPRLDGLPETHVVGDEEVDAGHTEGLPERLKLEGLDLDAGPVGGLEEVVLGRRDAVPAQRVQVGGEEAWLIEAAARDGLPVGAVQLLGVDLLVPQDLEGLPEGVILDAGEAHESAVGRRWWRRDALDEVLAGADPHDLAGLQTHPLPPFGSALSPSRTAC